MMVFTRILALHCSYVVTRSQDYIYSYAYFNYYTPGVAFKLNSTAWKIQNDSAECDGGVVVVGTYYAYNLMCLLFYKTYIGSW